MHATSTGRLPKENDPGPSTTAGLRSVCPTCGGIAPMAAPRWRDRPPMLYPDHYVWFVFLSALDLMLTWVILHNAGVEVNPVACLILDAQGLPGLAAFKFALVMFVIVMCEWVGRSDRRRGRKLSEWAVAITAIPVTVAFVQLLVVQ